MDALPLYDGHNRLVKIDYPRTDDVIYTYGGSDKAGVNGAGRLLRRVDESGTTDFTYGKLGETVAMTRQIERVTPLADPVTASFSYVSDYLGRLESITYPDGELVTYGYDSGGQIVTVTGTHYGHTTEYVKDIAYDAFGQRTYIEYGNGVRTSYTYDENRRWLDAIDTSSSWGATYQAMHYSFDLVGNVLGYTNTAGTYETSQTYGYDALYQLTSASGTTTNKVYGLTDYVSKYNQTYAFDEIGNMTKKTSNHTVSPNKTIGDDLNYNLGYTYYAGKSHQAEIIGNIYYKYDANGNVTEARKGGHSASAMPSGEVYRNGDVSYTDKGFALLRNGKGDAGENVWSRNYVWNEENRLKKSVEGDLTVEYRYGADGERAVKYSKRSETLYFDSMWQAMTDYPSLRQSKHVYVGKVRVASRLNISGNVDVGYEEANTYYYHPDHVGSAQLVTDPDGKEYERIEYTPYGELWVEKTSDSFDRIPFRFTGKELDDETGLYYYGARYLDPRTSTWLSADPALGDYIPVAPVDEEARKKNGNLPGMGGVYNLVNLHLYHYAGNNPVKYTDPDGKETGIPDLRGYFDGLMLKAMSLPGISLINALNSAGNAASNALHGKAEASAQFSFRLTEGKLYGSVSFSSKGLSAKTYSQMSDVLTQLEAVVSSPVRTKHGKDGSLTGIEFHIPVGDQSALKKFSAIIGGAFDVETGDMSGTVGGKLSTKLFGSSSFQLSLTLKSSTIGELPTVQGGNFADIFSDQKSKALFESLWKDQ